MNERDRVNDDLSGDTPRKADGPSERDVEALAKALRRTAVTRPSASWYEDIRRSMTLARNILTDSEWSAWFAERTAEARAEGAERKLAAVEALPDRWEWRHERDYIGVEECADELRAALRGDNA